MKTKKPSTVLKQWELPNGAKIKLEGGIYTFLKMDGMYAQWKSPKGEFQIGNFDGFVKEGKYYVLTKP